MSAAREEDITEAAADSMIKRVFQVANILAAVKLFDATHKTAENRLKNQRADEVRYGEDNRTAQPE
ncbi:hypothetical protein FBR02_13795 [Anaerolineae bacterium CFX9]|nr:hypothetical protein [Anaerolineae bacterium]MDL1901833.1 hypothetical protein [Anaerolineae bacterium CFX9]NOG48793.1 hypothetical protein [Chloroflexota bacterium]GIK28168.1 MAG: hypothetical protein BroJett007_13060 [Chloroflexota bacterium]